MQWLNNHQPAGAPSHFIAFLPLTHLDTSRYPLELPRFTEMAPSRVWTLLVACLCGPCLGRLVSVADLHGDFDHAVNILSSAKLIDKVPLVLVLG